MVCVCSAIVWTLPPEAKKPEWKPQQQAVGWGKQDAEGFPEAIVVGVGAVPSHACRHAHLFGFKTTTADKLGLAGLDTRGAAGFVRLEWSGPAGAMAEGEELTVDYGIDRSFRGWECRCVACGGAPYKDKAVQVSRRDDRQAMREETKRGSGDSNGDWGKAATAASGFDFAFDRRSKQ